MRRYLVSKLKPPSANKHNNPEYQNAIRKEAFAVHPEYKYGNPGHSFLDGDLYARVMYLYHIHYDTDVDNIAKRIIDAFKGHFYNDDGPIKHLDCTKIVLTDYIALEMNDIVKGDIPSEEFGILNRHLSNGSKTIVYFEVGRYNYQSFSIGSRAL